MPNNCLIAWSFIITSQITGETDTHTQYTHISHLSDKLMTSEPKKITAVKLQCAQSNLFSLHSLSSNSHHFSFYLFLIFVEIYCGNIG